MTWWRPRRAIRHNAEDIEQARRERKRTEHDLEMGRERWLDVSNLVAESRRIRKKNHMADDLRTIFGG